ncbi:unnamed protein product [Cladocopium goreaui]|uniref:Elongin-C n=1 Tax=Cladocopium goreaui TaxID=2562237 RepID=A0A9P1BLT7_9DINO|nr:unnamed protein product [Cladocopium goreaui]
MADGKALCFRSLADAESLRERLKSLSSVAIIGAGYVGVELAAGLAEVLPEAAAAGQIALFGSRFLPGCEEANQRRSAEFVDKLGIVRKEGRVTSVDAEGLTWSSADGESRKHECDLVIATGALAPSDSKTCLTLQLTALQDSVEKGRAVIDEYLRVAPGVFCLGDASAGSPATGQIAMQQAEAAAWNIYAQLSGLPRVAWRRFKPSALGEFIALGSTEAAGVVEASQMGNLLPPALPPAVARLAASATAAVSEIGSAKVDIGGKSASLLRRLAYLYRLPGLRHRLRVAENWLRRSSRASASGDLSANVRLMRPPLVRETSAWTFGRDRLRLASLVPFGQKKEVMEKIVLEDELSERLNWTTNSLVNAKKNGTPFRHLLLHGPPGTGKTLFARTLARRSGLDYAIMSGGDVGPLGKDAVGWAGCKVVEFAERTKKEAEERRKTRDAEGGRGGGFNDRQDIERREVPVDDSGYDEFGRRKKTTETGSKAERAAAALERLKQKRQVNSAAGRSRSRSGDGRDGRDGRRAREPKAPHAGFRPRGANHRVRSDNAMKRKTSREKTLQGSYQMARKTYRSARAEQAVPVGQQLQAIASASAAMPNSPETTALRKGLILFIDEADAFLRTGRGSESGAMSEEARNTLSAFLHHTGTESDKFVVVLATNIREILDKAVLDRVDESFEFPLPSLKERQRMLSMFMEEHIHKPTKRGKVIQVDEKLDDSFLEEVGAFLEDVGIFSAANGMELVSRYLRLISADGHEFFLDRRIAYECDTFKKMVEKEGFKEGQTNEIQLPTITGKLLEKVIEYLYFKYKYTDAKVPIPEFPIDDDVVLDLLLVANYLNLY